MELTFSAHKTPCLNKCFNEVRHQEETAETVIPDSYPDAASIAGSFASVLLRGKESHAGTAVIIGAVKAGAIYHPEDGSYPRLLEFYLPFSFTFDSPFLTETAQFTAELKIASVDARMINSRKVLLRVNIACEITAYSLQELISHKLQEGDRRLQLKEQTYSSYVLSELAERSFVMNETLEANPGQPTAVEIYKVRCNGRISDKKLVGSKVVFKGHLHCSILYRGENNALFNYTTQIPFSQYCELDQDYDEGIPVLSIAITGCDSGVNSDGSMQLTVNLLAQCLVYSHYQTNLIEDAYCVGAELTPQWNSSAMECCLDRKTEVLSLQQSVPGTLAEIIDTEIYDDFPVCRQSGDVVRITIPTFVRVMGIDNDHVAVSRQTRGEIALEYPLSDDAECNVCVTPFHGHSVRSGTDLLDLQCGTQAEMYFTARQEFHSLCGGSITETADQGSRSPSMIMRSMSREQPLWDVAKVYKTTVAALQSANEIESEYTPDHGLLLIPVS